MASDDEQDGAKGENMLKDISNRAKGGYLLWVVAHLFLLFAVSDGIFKKGNYNNGIDDFVPFTYNSWEDSYELSGYRFNNTIIKTPVKGGYKFNLDRYDITEFLFYLIVPVLLYFAYKLLQPQPKPSDHWKQYQKPKEDE